jgi:outer membrane immunogenic protein
MKTYSIAAGLGAVLLATSVMAADLPRKTAPVAPVYRPVPTFTWTGFYAGVNAGYGFGDFTGASSRSLKNPSGFLGGGQIGYNYQINQIVLGLETDLQASDIHAKHSAFGPVGSKSRLPYFGTVRARAGIAIDRFLPYITGGFAYGSSDTTIPGTGKASATHYGWVIGGGVEYAFTNNITARVEGLYMDLADKRIINGAGKIGSETGIVRAGLNYKF